MNLASPVSPSKFLARLNAKEKEIPDILENTGLSKEILQARGEKAISDSAESAKLWNYILESKKNLSIKAAILASNAITALNLARIPFSGRDLSFVRIPNADLSKGIFHKTNFTRADLQGVNFRTTYLAHAIFKEANLKGADFGQFQCRPFDSSKCKGGNCLTLYKNILAVGENPGFSDKKKGKIHLWSIDETYRPIYSWEVPHLVRSIAFTENGDFIIAVGKSHISIYDLNGKESLHKDLCSLGEEFVITSCSISTDHNFQRVACTSGKGDIHILNFSTGELTSLITGEATSSSLQLIPNQNQVLFATDKDIHLFDISEKKRLQSWTCTFPCFQQVVFCPSRRLLAGLGFAVAIWAWDQSEPIQLFHHLIPSLSEICGIPQRVAFSHDGAMLAIGTQKQVYVFCTTTAPWELIHLWTWGGTKFDIAALSFTSNDQSLVTLCEGENPRIWKLPERKMISSISKMHRMDEISTLLRDEIALTSDNRYIFNFKTHVLRIWDASTGICLWNSKQKFDRIDHFAVSENGKYLLIQSEKTATLASWSDHFFVTTIKVFEEESEIQGIGFFSSGRAAIIKTDHIETYDVETNRTFHCLKGKVTNLSSYVFSDNGQFLALSTHDGRVGVWNCKTSLYFSFPNKSPGTKATDLKIFQNEDFFYRVGNEIFLRSLSSQNVSASVQEFDEIQRISVTPPYFLLKKRNASPAVYELRENTYILIHFLHANLPPLLPKSFDTPDPEISFLYDDHRKAKQWVKKSKSIHAADHQSGFWCSQTAIHPHLPLIALGGDNGVIQIWNPLNGKLLDILYAHTDVITNLFFSQDGSVLFTLSRDGTLKKWYFETEKNRFILQWQTEPYSLVINSINYAQAFLDKAHEDLFIDEEYTSDFAVILPHLLKENSKFILQPNLFPSKGSEQETTPDVQSVNLDLAVLCIHRKILQNEDSIKVIESFLDSFPRLFDLVPSDFRFILNAMKDIGQSIVKSAPVNPIFLRMIHHLYRKPIPKPFYFTREILDLALRKIVRHFFMTSYRMQAQPEREVYEAIGDIFENEQVLYQALWFYTKTLQIDPGNGIVYYKRAQILLKNQKIELAREDLLQAKKLCPDNLAINQSLIQLE